MSYRTRNILLASGLAVLAAVFLLVYVSNARDTSEVGNDLVRVFVAGHDIGEGTPGSTLTVGGALVEKRVPERTRVPDAITSRTEVRGLVATHETLAGEQVTRRRFGPLAATGVLTQIVRHERAVQFAGDANQVLDGTVKAGDRVDVIGTWNVPHNCSTCKVVRTIVRGALVLGTSDDLPSLGSSTSSSTKPIQLRLTERQAERVFWMDKNGEWWLTLRPVVKPKTELQDRQSAETIAAAKDRRSR
jgi:Flp pilus assembly protein CpaB